MIRKQIKLIFSIIAFSTFVYASQAFSESMPMDFYPSIQPVISIAGGMDLSNPGEKQNVILVPVQQNQLTYGYTPDHKTTDTPFGQVFVGVRWNCSPDVSTQFGIMGYYYRPFEISGFVDPVGLGAGFRSFAFNYKIRSMGIMGVVKLMYNLSSIVHPFINGGVGIGVNRSTNFMQSVLPNSFFINPVPQSFYSNKTVTSLAYMVGAGVNFTIVPHLEFGVGYEYADLGKAELGLGPNALTSDTLRLKDLEVNQAYIELTYIGTGHVV